MIRGRISKTAACFFVLLSASSGSEMLNTCVFFINLLMKEKDLNEKKE